MAFKVLRSTQTDQDLGLILDHLIQSYLDLGDALPAAFTRAARRVESIEADMEALHKAPFQGTLLPEILPDLRRVTKNKAVFYFDVDEAEKTVRILAVFFGGQDHQRHMLKRLSSGPAAAASQTSSKAPPSREGLRSITRSSASSGRASSLS